MKFRIKRIVAILAIMVNGFGVISHATQPEKKQVFNPKKDPVEVLLL
jgi:hypothetical protein